MAFLPYIRLEVLIRMTGCWKGLRFSHQNRLITLKKRIIQFQPWTVLVLSKSNWTVFFCLDALRKCRFNKVRKNEQLSHNSILLTWIERRGDGVDAQAPAAHFNPSLIRRIGGGIVFSVWVPLIYNLKINTQIPGMLNKIKHVTTSHPRWSSVTWGKNTKYRAREPLHRCLCFHYATQYKVQEHHKAFFQSRHHVEIQRYIILCSAVILWVHFKATEGFLAQTNLR